VTTPVNGWILAEDAALKSLLSGITVSDDRNPARVVGTWFGQPDLELREQKYPYFTIDLIDIREAKERAQRGVVTLPYVPNGDTAPAVGTVVTYDFPIPYDLYYQVRSWVRHPRHDRQIMAEVMKNRLPSRYGSLYIPEDNTLRSLFMTGMLKRDTTESDRRLFSTIFNVTVLTELTQSAAITAAQVHNIILTVNQTAP
jgi:hypothetical protein